MNGWDIPQDIREHYGFSKDYELYRQLEDMDPEEYRQQRRKGSVPDILEVDARLGAVVRNSQLITPIPLYIIKPRMANRMRTML